MLGSQDPPLESGVLLLGPSGFCRRSHTASPARTSKPGLSECLDPCRMTDAWLGTSCERSVNCKPVSTKSFQQLSQLRLLSGFVVDALRNQTSSNDGLRPFSSNMQKCFELTSGSFGECHCTLLSRCRVKTIWRRLQYAAAANKWGGTKTGTCLLLRSLLESLQMLCPAIFPHT